MGIHSSDPKAGRREEGTEDCEELQREEIRTLKCVCGGVGGQHTHTHRHRHTEFSLSFYPRES